MRNRWSTAIVVTMVLTILLWAIPAQAHHGAFHADQHAWDSSSTVYVKAHSSCSTNCNTIKAEIKKDGVWYKASCVSQNDSCSPVYSPERAFSFPVTVQTYHGWSNGLFEGEGFSVFVYYA